MTPRPHIPLGACEVCSQLDDEETSFFKVAHEDDGVSHYAGSILYFLGKRKAGDPRLADEGRSP